MTTLKQLRESAADVGANLDKAASWLGKHTPSKQEVMSTVKSTSQRAKEAGEALSSGAKAVAKDKDVNSTVGGIGSLLKRGAHAAGEGISKVTK
jgi:hypothetical protein